MRKSTGYETERKHCHWPRSEIEVEEVGKSMTTDSERPAARLLSAPKTRQFSERLRVRTEAFGRFSYIELNMYIESCERDDMGAGGYKM